MSVDNDTPPLSRHGTAAELGVAIALCILVAIAVALRLYCRYLQGRKLAMDDYLIVFAFPLHVAMNTTFLITIFHYGQGLHTWQVTSQQLAGFWKSYLAGQVVYAISISAIRVSICLLFHKTLKVTFYRRAAYLTMICNIAWFFVSIFTSLFRCVPARKMFYPEVKGYCINENADLSIGPIWSLICDSLTWLLPLPVIWRLNLRITHQVALSCVFAIGLIVVAVGAVRIYTGFAAVPTDFTYDTSFPIWAMLEPGLAIVCACGPCYRPLVDFFRRRRSNVPLGPTSMSSASYNSRGHMTAGTRMAQPGLSEQLSNHPDTRESGSVQPTYSIDPSDAEASLPGTQTA